MKTTRRYALATGLRGVRDRHGDPITSMRVQVHQDLGDGMVLITGADLRAPADFRIGYDAAKLQDIGEGWTGQPANTSGPVRHSTGLTTLE